MGKGTRMREKRKQSWGNSGAAERGLNPVLKKILYWLIGIVVAGGSIAILVLSSMKNNGTILKRSDALRINDKTYKASELDYYYHILENNYQNQAFQMYYTYGYDIYGIDFSKSLFRQIHDKETGQTWGDLLLNTAIDNLYEFAVMEEEAKKNGFTLNEIQYRDVEKPLEMLEAEAQENNMSLGAYLKRLYGNAITLDAYKRYIEREVISSYYSIQLHNGIEITKDQIDIEYKNNPNNYDLVTYRAFTFNVELDKHVDEQGNDISDDETKKADQDKIEQAVADLKNELELVKSEQAFNKLAEEKTRSKDSSGNDVDGVTPEETLNANISYAYLKENELPAEWLFDETKAAPGEYYIDKKDNKITAYYFIKRSDNSEASHNVRHILIESEEKDDIVKARVDAILAEWEAGDRTEASFADLAKKYSADTSSAVNGGLIEGIGPGVTVKEFDEWVFSDDRKSGEVEIVFTDSFGYHIIYYVGEGRPYRDVLVGNSLKSVKFEEIIESIKKEYTIIRIESGLSKIK